MMVRKGQAALEYLVTYGWAILAILVVVGALAYFGLLNPSRYLPNTCEFGAQLKCSDFLLSDRAGMNGCLQIRFQNNFGDGIRIYNITTTDGRTRINFGDALPSNSKCVSDMSIPYANISKGQISETFYIGLMTSGTIRLVEGDRHPVQFIVTYSRNQTGAPLHNLTGEIFATIQPFQG